MIYIRMKRKRGDMNSLRSGAPAKPTSFFKVILSDIPPGSRLMIPPKFISAHGNDLKGLVFLRAPFGSVWKVELKRTDGQVWLRDGRPEFATHYSLSFGNFLVFRYEEKSTFFVIILDKSGAEIEYPSHAEQTCLSRNYQMRVDGATTNNNVGSREEVKNCYPTNYVASAPNHMLSKTTKSASACVEARLRPQENSLITSNKTMRIKDTDTPDNTRTPKVSINSENLFPDASTQEDIGKGGNRLTWVTSEADKTRVLASAKASESKPSIRINMQPSYVSRRTNLTVPRKFVTEYITQDHCNVILQRSDGRSWAAECKVYPTMAKIGAGWKIFVEDNSLAVDDVCLFELINCSENLLKVSIFRAAGAPSS